MKSLSEVPDCAGGVCPVEATVNLISGKWKSVIVFRLLAGKQRFGELKKSMPAITFRTLTLQLRKLEEDGIVQRTVYAEVPPRVEYALTELGQSMEPIIRAMYVWGVDYQKRTGTTKTHPIVRNPVTSHAAARQPGSDPKV